MQCIPSTMTWFMSVYGENHHNIVNNLINFKKSVEGSWTWGRGCPTNVRFFNEKDLSVTSKWKKILNPSYMTFSEHVLWVSVLCRALSLSHIWLFATPWIVAQKAPLSIGILQARVLGWVAIPFSRESSWSRNQTGVSCIAGRLFTIWATWEAHSESLVVNIFWWSLIFLQ